MFGYMNADAVKAAGLFHRKADAGDVHVEWFSGSGSVSASLILHGP